MPLETASILISALAQIAGEYGVAMPLAGIARRILDDKARQNAFAEAVAAAYADLRGSEHGEIAQALLDPRYLSRPAVAQELLSGVLVAGQVDYEQLQNVYTRSTGHGERVRLVFEDEHGGAHYIDQHLLPRLVRVGGEAVSLVVLDACYSKSLAISERLKSPYAKAARRDLATLDDLEEGEP